MFKVLTIGNSFGTDCNHYLNGILAAAGIECKNINLYIGGCFLEKHWANMEQNACAYQYEINGQATERRVSIEEVLKEEAFDVVVVHQASGDSGWAMTYEPFLSLMIGWLKERTRARIVMNETWAYETGSPHQHFMRYDRSTEKMFQQLKAAYHDAAERHQLPLIETGEVVQKLRELPYFSGSNGVITRDGFHLGFLYGRYAAALCWARKLCGIDVMANAFVPSVNFMPSEKADPAIIDAIKTVVCETITLSYSEWDSQGA